MRTKLFALYAAVGLALLAAGPGLAAAADSAGNTDTGNTLAVSVSQSDDGSATVSVTQNDTGVENASVHVETADNVSYAGTGNYTTDSDGTVGLPALEQNVTVDVTAMTDNHTATTAADLTVASMNATNMTEFDTFGLEVSAYVSDLLSDENRTGGIGPAVASFVTANNPGNAPDHAGPPAHGENESDDNETHPSERQGPPADIFGDDDENETEDENETDDRRGPPEDAGPPEDRGPDSDDDENETEDDENETDEDRRGPPEDAGPPEDRDDDDSENETEDDETEESEDESDDDSDSGDDDNDSDDDDSDDDDSDDDDGDRGPPEDAGPPDDRGN
ncbi:hypothetical protein NDI54_03205 [Haloarcula sp. S1AR25-5A]|uniref:Uncharacterized protein n=1 Tax=Haloarcula terrestris TaxID=2950533 RepID=A0AAE4JH98_9EURY|nr:hypothetical protein [Haloarcula terrestris]MDS0220354.1 hypothetical protein [Haloarcula terrestris]